MHNEIHDACIVLCSLCLYAIEPEDQNWCQCGECICENCPHSACSCIEPDPGIEALRLQLRRSAISKGMLEAQREFMGLDSLTNEQQSHLRLLRDVVKSLRAEMDNLYEIQDGID